MSTHSSQPPSSQPPGRGRGSRSAGGFRLPHYADRLTDDPSTFDELTELFLGDLIGPVAITPGRAAGVGNTNGSGSAASVTSSTTTRETPCSRLKREESSQRSEPTIELLILGHLPTLASIWGSQYLRDISRESHQPVASVRIQGGFVTVELFGERDEISAKVSKAASIDEAVEEAARWSNHWVIRTDTASELAYVSAGGVNTVTILTSADEAAAIGAYRTIKLLATHLAGAGSNQSRSHVEHETPHSARKLKLRVVVMAADAQQAQRVGEKLADTARQYLQQEVEYSWSSARINASHPAALLLSGAADNRPEHVLEMIGGAMRRGVGSRMNSASPSVIAEQGSSKACEDMPSRLQGQMRSTEAVDAPAQTNVTPTPIGSGPSELGSIQMSAQSEAIKPRVLRNNQTSACATAPTRLIEHINAGTSSDDEHLQPMNVTCPYAPTVEFAVDRSGQPHLLAKFDGDACDETSLGTLMIASEWMTAHATLIRAAMNNPRPDATPEPDFAGKPILHVFVTQAKKVRRLLETPVRIHLLAPVVVAGVKGWFSTPLN